MYNALIFSNEIIFFSCIFHIFVYLFRFFYVILNVLITHYLSKGPFPMKLLLKKLSAFSLCLLLTFSLAGCSSSQEKKYQNYIKSLISINYLGVTDDYIKATGANEADAIALYEANIDLLTDNLLAYYNLQITNSPEIRAEYVELAKSIYKKANYKVSKAYKKDNLYFVDVTISPFDFFNQVSPEVSAYIESFNTRVTAGEFNDYTLTEYETEFSVGFLEILNAACLEMTYAEPVTVTVQIVSDGDTFYISNKDFLAIDAAMFNVASGDEAPNSEEAPTESEEPTNE